MSGFEISIEEFKNMTHPQQMIPIYQNIVSINKGLASHIEHDDKRFSTTNFRVKILTIIVVVLSIIAGIGKYVGII